MKDIQGLASQEFIVLRGVVGDSSGQQYAARGMDGRRACAGEKGSVVGSLES